MKTDGSHSFFTVGKVESRSPARRICADPAQWSNNGRQGRRSYQKYGFQSIVDHPVGLGNTVFIFEIGGIS